jgi:hypothetical protein
LAAGQNIKRWGLLPAWLLAAHSLAAATTTRIFVEPFGDKSGVAQLRDEIVKLLGKERGLVLISDRASADLILAGSGETYIKGYLSTNPRVRYLNSDAKPVYGGYLSVELKGRDQETIWSYLVTPRRFGPEDINRNLAGQMTRKLIEAIHERSKAAKP